MFVYKTGHHPGVLVARLPHKEGKQLIILVNHIYLQVCRFDASFGKDAEQSIPTFLAKLLVKP